MWVLLHKWPDYTWNISLRGFIKQSVSQRKHFVCLRDKWICLVDSKRVLCSSRIQLVRFSVLNWLWTSHLLTVLTHKNINSQDQEIIKVREWIPHIGPLTKVIRIKLFLDIVPSSFADITRALRGCFRGGSVSVSFHFVLKQSKTTNSVEKSFLIFWLQAKELRLSECCNTFRNFNGSLDHGKTDVSCSNNNWMNGKEMFRQMTNDKRQTNLQTQARQPNKQMVESAGRRSLPKYWAKSSLSGNGNSTPKTSSIKKQLNIQPTNLARSWIHSVCLYSVRNIPKRICKTASKFDRRNFKTWLS